MELNVRCPGCRSKLRIPAEARGREVRCPKCESAFKARPAGACPACKAPLPPGSVLCTQCGYDFRTKKKLEGSFVAEKEPKRKKKRADALKPEAAGENWAPVGWSDVLRSPLDVEFVLAETVVLTIWAFFWIGLFLSLVGSMFMLSMGIMGIFMVSALISGIIRMWMLTSDLSLLDVGRIFMGLVATAGGVGALAHWINPDLDALTVGFVLFLALVLLGVALRALSFFFGRYFGICRRAAMQTAVANSDRGGFIDVAFALGLSAIAGLPLALTAAAARTADSLEAPLPGGPLLFIVLGTVALLWGYLYLPMGVAVVALRGSLNPAVVFEWIGRTFADYLLLLLLLLPFHLAVWAVAALASTALAGLTQLAPLLGMLLQIVYGVLAVMLLGQYVAVATLVALGLVLRRNEANVHWLRYAKQM